MAAVIRCPNCARALPPAVAGGEAADCACGQRTRAVAFPALLRPLTAGSFGQRVIDAGESTCFYHPAKRAEVVCDGCGRFLCGLCDIDMVGEHLCAACLETGNTRRKEDLETERVLHGQIAISTVLVSVFFWFIAPFMAAASLFIVARYWNAPDGIGATPKLAKILAVILSLLVLGGSAALFITLYYG